MPSARRRRSKIGAVSDTVDIHVDAWMGIHLWGGHETSPELI